MYPVFSFLGMAGLIGMFLFGALSYLNPKNETTHAVLCLLSFAIMAVGACGAFSVEETYATDIAVDRVAQDLNVAETNVQIDGVQCIASAKYSCVTWRGTFHVGNQSGFVEFDTESAVITKRWEGNLVPIGGTLAGSPNMRVVINAIAYLLGTLFFLWRMIPFLKRRFGKVVAL